MSALSINHADLEFCIPFRIVAENENITDGRLGGKPPIGIQPTNQEVSLIYFATIRLLNLVDRFASIFVADFEELLPVRGKVNQPGLIEVIVHGPIPRGNDLTFASKISEHGLQFLTKTADQIVDLGEQIIVSDHKVGGYPHIIREKGNLKEEIDFLYSDGYLQVLQFDFPGREDDPVSGDWFFGDGVFCLFGKFQNDQAEWCWYWDM